MIFVFEAPAVQTFWMKNTLIPLDMVFIARNGTVTTVAARVPASTLKTSDFDVARRRGRGEVRDRIARGRLRGDRPRRGDAPPAYRSKPTHDGAGGAGGCLRVLRCARWPRARSQVRAPTQLSGEAILGTREGEFRAYVRPPFDTYTLVQGALNWTAGSRRSYTLHVWCATPIAPRSSAPSATTHDDPLKFVRPAFNQAVDPGPPTADMFERKALEPPGRGPASSSIYRARRRLRARQRITASKAYARRRSYLLRVAPIREPERNRLRKI